MIYQTITPSSYYIIHDILPDGARRRGSDSDCACSSVNGLGAQMEALMDSGQLLLTGAVCLAVSAAAPDKEVVDINMLSVDMSNIMTKHIDKTQQVLAPCDTPNMHASFISNSSVPLRIHGGFGDVEIQGGVRFVTTQRGSLQRWLAVKRR